jgi:putative flippase GtrA
VTVGRGQLATFLRFVLVNVLNTGIYWGLYLLFLLAMPYFWANAVALLIAVLLAYVGNARYAFGVAPSRTNLVKYLIANGTTVLARMVVVWVLVGPLPLPEEWAPPAAVAVTMPVAFLLTKWAMAERPSRRPAGAGAAAPAPDTRAGTARPAA